MQMIGLWPKCLHHACLGQRGHCPAVKLGKVGPRGTEGQCRAGYRSIAQNALDLSRGGYLRTFSDDLPLRLSNEFHQAVDLARCRARVARIHEGEVHWRQVDVEFHQGARSKFLLHASAHR